MRELAILIVLSTSLVGCQHLPGASVPGSWASSYMEMDKPSTLRTLMPALTNSSSIRLELRPLVEYSPNLSPFLLDAGSCVHIGTQVACLPSTIIIGAMKAGTAELQGWLSRHPAMSRYGGPSSSGTGEAHYFDSLGKPLRALAAFAHGGSNAVGFRMRGAEPAYKYTFEKTPRYLFMKDEQIDRMHRFLPSARLIAILRNPVSRSYSHFQHRCRQGNFLVGLHPKIKGRVFASKSGPAAVASSLEAVGVTGIKAKDLAVLNGPCTNEQFASLVLHTLNGTRLDHLNMEQARTGGLLARGYYARQLQAFRRHYPHEQIYVMLTEDLFHDFPGEMDRLQTWLGLPYFDYRPHIRVNERGFTVLQGLKSKTDNSAYEPLNDELKAILGKFYARGLHALTDFIDADRLRTTWGIDF
ncbi:uncharacterized protein MONBRDRAFT_24926 [Monosiga brevicollis MX1]|uniref:Sulfotransferase domain-containing protein n=1 Tax=Monosiga brevicollis TaxID=81824 RepID=A9UY55_MONBE|nr:uncharacterized protein MONBRDRAFT_24926 [Monosiga brevicollis MX1]EDQ89802.1 predicted protein [Monosiga brevicollis MX1]|eukprot:XP_001745224.1 hypothetical protein [Monosiga brevicollis MX1]